MLPPVPHLDGKKIRGWYSPTALAFLGDSIWEVCLPAISQLARCHCHQASQRIV